MLWSSCAWPVCFERSDHRSIRPLSRRLIPLLLLKSMWRGQRRQIRFKLPLTSLPATIMTITTCGQMFSLSSNRTLLQQAPHSTTTQTPALVCPNGASSALPLMWNTNSHLLKPGIKKDWRRSVRDTPCLRLLVNIQLPKPPAGSIASMVKTLNHRTTTTKSTPITSTLHPVTSLKDSSKLVLIMCLLLD